MDFLVAVKLRSERLRLELSVAQVAGRLGLTTAGYMRRESGSERFSAEELRILLQMFGRDPAWLYARA